MVDAALRIVLHKHGKLILHALGEVNFARGGLYEIPTRGIPGVQNLVLYAWPDPLFVPKTVYLDVVQMDDRVLEEPLSVELDAPMYGPSLSFGEPAPWRRERSTWEEMPPGQTRREVTGIGADGRPTWSDVDTTVHRFRMVCHCGRERYARGNSTHQVDACHVCTRARRLRKRALAQFRQRQKKNSQVIRAKKLPPNGA